MRVGVVTTSYPRRPGEAAGAFVAELSQWIADDHAVEVVAAGDPSPSEDWQALPITRVSAAPGLFYEGGAPDALRSAKRHCQAAAFQARLTQKVRERAQGWDAMVAHWLAPSAIACSLASRDKALWAIAHGGDVHLLERLKLTGLIARRLNRTNVHLSFVSSDLRDRFARNAGKSGAEVIARSTVASMGVELERFQSLKDSVTAEDVPRVVFVGRLVALKGVDTLLDALVGLDRSCRVVIAGGGPMKEALHERARGLGLELDWRGEVGAPERDQLLASATVVVVPSRSDRGRSEGMPLIAIEALASGSQLITTKSGGLSEIPESICHHIDEDDPQALRTTLRRVLDGRHARESPSAWLAGRAWDAVGPVILPGLSRPHNR